jgi:serine/threonine protein kinase
VLNEDNEICPAIVYEYTAAGSLDDINCLSFKQNKSRFPYGLLPFLVTTVEFMRKQNVAHRDIKCANILALDLQGNWRLGDLGSMCRLGDSPRFTDLPLLADPLVRCTYNHIPKALLEKFRMTDDHLYHTNENMMEEVLWLDIYGAMDVIATTKARYMRLTQTHIEDPKDDVLRICWKGLMAASYKECEAAWNELVNFVNE